MKLPVIGDAIGAAAAANSAAVNFAAAAVFAFNCTALSSIAVKPLEVLQPSFPLVNFDTICRPGGVYGPFCPIHYNYFLDPKPMTLMEKTVKNIEELKVDANSNLKKRQSLLCWVDGDVRFGRD